ncbi:MAG TPA: hypothetical protein VMG36_05930 [Thermoplasmata archaeon]|nr:hypothetical protein [Thermoplasmata archaeon]
MPDQFTLLLEWRRNEAAGRGLAKLPPDFFSSTTAYLADLRRSYESDLRENPSGRKGEISRQTYQRASQVARDIVEARVQKVLALAFQASIGGPREVANALNEERATFERMLGVLLDYRRNAAPYLETGPSGPSSPPAAAPPPAPAPRSPERPTAAPPSPRPAAAGLVYVRIVKDGKPIEIGAETIDLRQGDLLSVPAATAKLLIDSHAAEPVRSVPVARP